MHKELHLEAQKCLAPLHQATSKAGPSHKCKGSDPMGGCIFQLPLCACQETAYSLPFC